VIYQIIFFFPMAENYLIFIFFTNHQIMCSKLRDVIKITYYLLAILD